MPLRKSCYSSVFIKNTSACKGTHTIQSCVVQGSRVTLKLLTYTEASQVLAATLATYLDGQADGDRDIQRDVFP